MLPISSIFSAIPGTEGMTSRPNLIKRVLRASITNDRELAHYVICISVTCLTIALAVDVFNQIVFFIDWPTSLRSWMVTTLVVLALAIPISRTFGKAHLDLYRAKLLVDELSLTDSLTGLPNRRAFMEVAKAETSEAMALVILDIDRFKHVNDTHGHFAGDTVIRSVGQIMAAELGALGRISRIGGEEFALLSAGIPIEDFITKLFAFHELIRATPIIVGGKVIMITISAGVALLSEGETFARLYADADRALYVAKTSGRNGIRFSSALEALHGPRCDHAQVARQYGTAE
jgi:diguanylate cyclase (GGDEF)-like protein